MKQYEVSIIFGHSFLNDAGRSVYGDNKIRKVLLKGEAETESLCIAEANTEFGVTFKHDVIIPTYSYKISKDCCLVLKIKEDKKNKED